jgi:hypothetical protein
LVKLDLYFLNYVEKRVFSRSGMPKLKHKIVVSEHLQPIIDNTFQVKAKRLIDNDKNENNKGKIRYGRCLLMN